jgi:hypothetical protein
MSRRRKSAAAPELNPSRDAALAAELAAIDADPGCAHMADFCKAAAVHRHTHDAERDADECVWCSSDLARARGTATVVLDDDELLADPELDPDELED